MVLGTICGYGGSIAIDGKYNVKDVALLFLKEHY